MLLHENISSIVISCKKINQPENFIDGQFLAMCGFTIVSIVQHIMYLAVFQLSAYRLLCKKINQPKNLIDG